jgi:hypothetical protein
MGGFAGLGEDDDEDEEDEEEEEDEDEPGARRGGACALHPCVCRTLRALC